MIKLIATDMDGTFLDSKKEFSPEFSSLFFEMQQKGIKFAIASGNQYYRLYQKFVPMSNDMIFIAENGSYIANGAKELYCSIIDRALVNKIVELIEKTPRIFMIMCGRKGAYVESKYFEYKNEVKKYYCSYAFINSFDEVDDDILKIAIFDPAYNIREFENDLRKEIPNGLKLVTSGNEWMDIMNEEVNKGVAMNFIQNEMGISKDECAAFGDQMNDYELLSEVKYAYAMSNAIDAIKEIAYEVVLSNDEQGVIEKIKEILKEID